MIANFGTEHVVLAHPQSRRDTFAIESLETPSHQARPVPQVVSVEAAHVAPRRMRASCQMAIVKIMVRLSVDGSQAEALQRSAGLRRDHLVIARMSK